MVVGVGLGSATGADGDAGPPLQPRRDQGRPASSPWAAWWPASAPVIWVTCGVSAGACRWPPAAVVLGGLSLIGVPLTAGFVSKWYLVLAAVERGLVARCRSSSSSAR